MTRQTKQVIVMIDKFPDGKGGKFSPRKGKMIAQACHASIAFLTRRIEDVNNGCRTPEQATAYGDFDAYKLLDITPAMRDWMRDSFAKITARVKSEEELLEVFEKAKAAGLEVHLVTDSGRTEFKEPTITCLAIGPDYVENIDPITAHLDLL